MYLWLSVDHVRYSPSACLPILRHLMAVGTYIGVCAPERPPREEGAANTRTRRTVPKVLGGTRCLRLGRVDVVCASVVRAPRGARQAPPGPGVCVCVGYYNIQTNTDLPL